VIAKPACAVERMEARHCDLLAIAHIVEPGGILERRSPVSLDKVDDEVNPRSHGSGVVEPGLQSSEKSSRDTPGLGVF
jgi:hypothetical protein